MDIGIPDIIILLVIGGAQLALEHKISPPGDFKIMAVYADFNHFARHVILQSGNSFNGIEASERKCGQMMIEIRIISFIILAVFRMPVALALGFATMLTLWFFSRIPMKAIPYKMVNGLDSYVFLAIPLFLLAGKLMNAGGITDRLFQFTRDLSGGIRGGLAHAISNCCDHFCMDVRLRFCGCRRSGGNRIKGYEKKWNCPDWIL